MDSAIGATLEMARAHTVTVNAASEASMVVDVPQEFANLLFENSDENILREETFEGETFFYTENMKSYQEAEAVYKRLVEKGFKGAKLVAFHKYDDISVQKAREILSQP